MVITIRTKIDMCLDLVNLVPGISPFIIHIGQVYLLLIGPEPAIPGKLILIALLKTKLKVYIHTCI